MKKRLLLLLAMPLLFVGCSKKDPSPANPTTPGQGPAEYQVVYTVTAVKYTSARIIYRDNTGTVVTEENVPLPKTYSFKRTMKSPDAVSCGVFPAGGDNSYSVSANITLNGTTVSSVTAIGPDPQTVVASYILP